MKGESTGKELGAVMPFPGVPLSQRLHVFTNLGSEPCPLDFLWNLHYINMID